jgi:hypothetical protein
MRSFNANAAAFFQLAAHAKALEDHHPNHSNHCQVAIVRGEKLVVLQHEAGAAASGSMALVEIQEPRPTRSIHATIWEDIVTR